MEFYTVAPGDTLFSIARTVGLPLERLAADNQLVPPYDLVPGQTLVVRFPLEVYDVQPGDTLSAIARRRGTTVRRLYQNNPELGGEALIYPGQTLVLSYMGPDGPAITVNGYAYPDIAPDLLRAWLPFLTYLSPFTYGFTPQGDLLPLEDGALLSAAAASGVCGLMHLSTLTEQGTFSSALAHTLLGNEAAQDRLVSQVEATILEKGYSGLDIDFEFLEEGDALAYADLISRFRSRLEPQGRLVAAALVPKVSADQPGSFYRGHNYRAIGQAAHRVLLMAYEWGYTYGPPMAVAPLPSVRRVVEYALSEIPAEKIWLGVPNYGYDWPLPFQQGFTRATSISQPQAVDLARRYGATIQFDPTAQAPWFRYRDEGGVLHEVWFEDARSIAAKLALVEEYGLDGIGYWNIMRPFPQNWAVLTGLYTVPGRPGGCS